MLLRDLWHRINKVDQLPPTVRLADPPTWDAQWLERMSRVPSVPVVPLGTRMLLVGGKGHGTTHEYTNPRMPPTESMGWNNERGGYYYVQMLAGVLVYEWVSIP